MDPSANQGAVNNTAANRFAALIKLIRPSPPTYNDHTGTEDYKDLITDVVDNLQGHFFATGETVLPV